MTTTVPTKSARVASFFINRNFALLWSGQSISVLGDYIFNATLILWIGARLAQGQSWAPLAVSGVLVATALPTLLVGPLAGVFVDRWNKRSTMLAMDLCRAVLNLLLLVLSISRTTLPVVSLVEIYGVVLLMTTCSQFFNPAAVALLGSIVAKDDLTRASGRQEATTGLATILGLSLSAPLFFGVGVQWALLLNSISFLVSFATILMIRPSEVEEKKLVEQKESFFHDFQEGLRFYAQNAALVTMLVAASIFIIGAGTVNTLNFFFITDNLHLSAAMFSYINAAFGAGAIIGAIIATQWAKWFKPRNMFWISLLFTGLLLISYARSTSPVLAFLIFFLLGMPNAVSNAMLTPLLLNVTPGQFVGRVVAVLLPALTLVRVLAMALAGYLDSNVLANFRLDIFAMHFGATDTLFMLAGLITIVASLYAQFNLKKQMKVEN